jgi:adenosylcobinamide kinase/adenosylcobinamide-phosphate guanylyltransferase
VSEVILVTGGARSGKSLYAEALASKKSGPGTETAEATEATEAAEAGGKVLYLATAQITDEEMADRIRRHKGRRPESWLTWERHRDFAQIALTSASASVAQASESAGAEGPPPADSYDTILMDDIGNLLMGVLFDEIPDADTCALAEFDRVEEIVVDELRTLIDFARAQDKNLILVTNEIGLGLVPAYRLGRYYRDILGRANRRTAELADRVVFLVSGIPLTLKPLGEK